MLVYECNIFIFFRAKRWFKIVLVQLTFKRLLRNASQSMFLFQRRSQPYSQFFTRRYVSCSPEVNLISVWSSYRFHVLFILVTRRVHLGHPREIPFQQIVLVKISFVWCLPKNTALFWGQGKIFIFKIVPTVAHTGSTKIFITEQKYLLLFVTVQKCYYSKKVFITVQK